MSHAPEGRRPPVGGAVDPDLLEGVGPGARGDVWPGADVLVAVGVGGALGATSRYGLARLVPTDGLGVPVATLVANVGGSLLLGVLTALALARFPDRRFLRPMLGVGVLGAFTTYSTFAVELSTRLGQGELVVAVGYGLFSVVAGVAAAALGLTLGRALGRR
ncbi:MAG: CrcB family protein [Microthrixaceae bacterium]